MVAVLTDPFGVGHMGITAENLAAKHGITREAQDAFAVESQRRAAAAIDAGHFKSQIVPIVKQTRKGDVVFDTDEHVKRGTTLEALAKMRPAFKKDGTVTAGNASGINDGAAFFVLAAADVAAKSGHKAMARLVSYAVAGVPNDVMGEGPIPATRLALKKAGLTLDQMDVIESNEAFAAQALSVSKVLGLDPVKTNPNVTTCVARSSRIRILIITGCCITCQGIRRCSLAPPESASSRLPRHSPGRHCPHSTAPVSKTGNLLISGLSESPHIWSITRHTMPMLCWSRPMENACSTVATFARMAGNQDCMTA